MTRAVNVRPSVHLAGAIPGRTACGSHIYVGMPGSVTTSAARVTCGRCERSLASARAIPTAEHGAPAAVVSRR